MNRRSVELITALENGGIHLPAAVDTREVRDRVMEVASLLGDRVVIQKGRQLYAGAVAGVIDTGQVRIQILPKIYESSNDRDNQKKNAEFLFQLLKESGGLSRGMMSEAQAHIASGRVDVIETVIYMIARELETLLVRGVPRRYHPLRETSPVVRGRIDLPQLMRQGGLVTRGIPVEYAPLQRDNPLTRLLRALATRLQSVTRSERTRALLSRADHLLHGTTRLPLTPQLVEGVKVGRYELLWQPFVSFAGQLVQGRVPNPTGVGHFQAVGWLFPLQLLYQAVVRKALVQTLLGSPLQLSAATRRHMLMSLAGAPVIEANPDYLLSQGESHRLVADAKWKVLEKRGSAHGLTAADVYQMTAYMARFDVGRGLLLYPHVSWMPDSWAETYEVQGPTPTGRRLTLGAVDIRGLVSGGAETATARTKLGDLIRRSL
ncbi:hypothetical protein D3875_03490 [Deinococcus cavernae]|uniref:Restriction endonuclease n=1 Tax=Deinococcus cavernae TaxID=2320857 RepID=A0A418VEU4_9DEIO|nr:hypothetical protein [Deinococcus cavernae]RJF74617.1 hypothetical protein D3875_03490 [Deinococcus cavernae]